MSDTSRWPSLKKPGLAPIDQLAVVLPLVRHAKPPLRRRPATVGADPLYHPTSPRLPLRSEFPKHAIILSHTCWRRLNVCYRNTDLLGLRNLTFNAINASHCGPGARKPIRQRFPREKTHPGFFSVITTTMCLRILRKVERLLCWN